MLGIGGKLLSWIREFLYDQTMCVKVAGNLSSLKNFTSGVSQRPVLGPVLFLIYINYIASSVDCCCKAFVDDFKFYLSFPQNTCVSILQGMMGLQKDLDKLCSVTRSWNLRLNISKCAVMRFSENNADNRMDCNYSIDGKLLKFVTSHRDLDMLVESKLRIHDHVGNVV